MSTLAERKQIELQEKLASLQNDFDAWLALAETDTAPLRLHKSQLRALVGTLKSMVEAYQQVLPKEAPDESQATQFLSEARNTESMFLATHSIWAFFRKKLAQRLEPGFSNFLDAADELAWSCYEPAYLSAKRPPKEPPLIFLNGALSPFMVARQQSFVPEDVPPRFLAMDEFKQLVSRLPVPVIGIPWAQCGHLPDVLSVAHEAGHVIEDDFGLDKILNGAIETAVDPERRARWLEWRSEIFADLWACAALGPAYAYALSDFLAGDPLREAEEKGQLAKYPVPALRMAINIRALEKAKFNGANATPLESLRQIWKTNDLPAEQRADATAVVKALLTLKLKPLGNKTVLQILGPFNPARFKEADHVYAALRREAQALGTGNVRTVFAAVRQGYDTDPAAWMKDEIAKRVLIRFDRNQPPSETLLGLGTRSKRVRETEPEPDNKLANELLSKLRSLLPEA